MNKNQRRRKALKIQVSQALSDEIAGLSTVIQDVLIDDLVTAFESRFAVLNKAESKVQLNLECNVIERVAVTQ
jgi:hypothetical protein